MRTLCAFGGSPQVKMVYKDKLFGKGEQAVVIENLPVRQCGNCGERYYDPEISLLIDAVLAHPEKQQVRRQVNVVALAACECGIQAVRFIYAHLSCIHLQCAKVRPFHPHCSERGFFPEAVKMQRARNRSGLGKRHCFDG